MIRSDGGAPHDPGRAWDVGPAPLVLSPEQLRAVEWGAGPLMVLAGAGTGKTTVIVERVAWLLHGIGDAGAQPRVDPENVLVLTYNTRAAIELVERCETRLGPAVASRVRIHNFHGLGHRILRDHAAEAGLPAQIEVLDAAGQRLLLRDVREGLDLVYHQFQDLRGQLAHLADVVNRARDELVTPEEYRAHADAARNAFEARHGRGAFRTAIDELLEAGDQRPIRDVRRALLRGGAAEGHRIADRQARRAAATLGERADLGARDGGTLADGRTIANRLAAADLRTLADGLGPTFLRDAEALEVLRLLEEADVFAAYVARLRERGALDFGEQIVRAVELLQARPNILRRYQHQFRHVLVDEFQDANVAQIMLLELLGRAPDRPDNVVVVGDDDQSIYRFRGASYAAFEQFRARFGRPPAWDPDREAAPVAETTLDLNLRSPGAIVSAADRLVAHNERRLKRNPLRATAPGGDPVELIVAVDERDEAVAVVEALERALRQRPAPAGEHATRARPRWGDAAILYRKHRHRDSIGQQLRLRGIPFTVVGGAGLFDHADVRDLECAIRVLAQIDDSISAMRLLAAAPWRLDARAVLRLARAAQFDGRSVMQAASDAVRDSSLPVDAAGLVPAPPLDIVADAFAPLQLPLVLDSAATDPSPVPMSVVQGRRASSGQRPARFLPAPLPDAMRAGLAPLIACVDDLGPRAGRDGPFTLLEEYVVRAGLLRDLVASATPDAQRAVLAISAFLRFVSDWQRDHPRGSLVDFVQYLDAYQEVGGDLDVESGATDVDAVQLMTIHQAKGLEWDVVVVPRLVEGQFPDDRVEEPAIPVELLRQAPPPDFREAEERRLCYVAMTRARRRLILTTIDGEGGRFRPSRFVAEIAGPDGQAADVSVSVRGVANPASAAPAAEPDDTPESATPGGGRAPATRAGQATTLDPGMDVRRRAAELVGLLEHVDQAAAGKRAVLTAELLALAGAASPDAGQGSAGAGLPLRAIGAEPGAGAELLRLIPVLDGFSHTSFATYLECPLAYAFQRVYRIPVPEAARPGYFAFGSMVHEALEGFVRAGRDARAAGLTPPGEAVLAACFDRAWRPLAFPDRPTADTYRVRAPAVLRNFLARERSRDAEPLCLEQSFRLVLDPGDGGLRAYVGGAIDRIDRLPDGSLELIDYKTGRPKSQVQVDADDQLSTYALAMREGAVPDPETGMPLPVPARLTLYFPEADEWISTTRSNAQLDEHLARLVGLVARIRSGDFVARPDFRRCDRCDYRRLCPNRWGTPA